jgi:hypothetical protein
MAALMGGAAPGPAQGAGNPLGSIDFNAVPDAGRTILLPTDVQCEFEIKNVQLQQAKTGARSQMIVLEMVSTFPQGYEGVKVWDQCSFEPTSLWKVKSVLAACGLLENGRFTGRSYADLQGNVVRATVFHDNYQGRTKNKIAGGYEEAWETPGLDVAAPTPAPTTTGAPTWVAPPAQLTQPTPAETPTQPDWPQPTT